MLGNLHRLGGFQEPFKVSRQIIEYMVTRHFGHLPTLLNPQG